VRVLDDSVAGRRTKSALRPGMAGKRGAAAQARPEALSQRLAPWATPVCTWPGSAQSRSLCDRTVADQPRCHSSVRPALAARREPPGWRLPVSVEGGDPVGESLTRQPDRLSAPVSQRQLRSRLHLHCNKYSAGVRRRLPSPQPPQPMDWKGVPRHTKSYARRSTGSPGNALRGHPRSPYCTRGIDRGGL